MLFTTIYVQGDDGFVGVVVEELPALVAQGRTIEEARENVLDAVRAVLAVYRDEAAVSTADRRILLREVLTIENATAEVPS